MKAIFLLPSRVIMFAVFQAIIALVLGSWHISEKYWLLSGTVTNLVSIAFLIALFKSEGRKFIDLFCFKKISWKKDLLIFSGISLISGPVAMLPGYFLGKLLWSDNEIPFKMMFQPIPLYLVYFLLFAFPFTIVFAELATYFGYIMPGLKANLKHPLPVIILPVFFLSLQHCTLPLIFDLRFIAYRGLTYFPFALLIGITLYRRPNLFPYFAVLHGLMDLGTVIVLLKI